MRILFLLRHGKSDADAGAEGDEDRPLAKRGRKAAKFVGRFLRLARQAPDSAVSSSALRARETVEIAVREGGWGCPIRTTRALYESDPSRVLAEIRSEPDSTQRLLLAGHEPTWSELASRLVGGGSLRVPTACVIRIDFDVDSWREVDFGAGELVWLIPPKIFTEGDFDF